MKTKLVVSIASGNQEKKKRRDLDNEVEIRHISEAP